MDRGAIFGRRNYEEEVEDPLIVGLVYLKRPLLLDLVDGENLLNDNNESNLEYLISS